jgi:hypothetical protein
VIVPGIADYELRRELIRAGKTAGLQRLDAARTGFEFDPTTQAALDQAALLWASVRNAGLATAHPAALDGDAILAAQTILAADPGDVVTIATNNPQRLTFLPAMKDCRPSLREGGVPSRSEGRQEAVLLDGLKGYFFQQSGRYPDYHVRRNEVARKSHAKTWRAEHRGVKFLRL